MKKPLRDADGYDNQTKIKKQAISEVLSSESTIVKMANPRRKPEFRLDTRIVEEYDGKFYVKGCGSARAKSFLENLIINEAKAKEFFAAKADVLCGSLRDSAVYYRFLPYPTLEQMIGRSLKAEDQSFGTHLIQKFINFLDELPNEKCIPFEFVEEFGIGKIQTGQRFDCLRLGVLDCVPSNILVGHHKWYVIDNEWVYDFPIPKDFIIFRSIYTLITNLQKEIRAAVSVSRPAVLVEGYFDNKTYMPSIWLPYLRQLRVPIKTLYYWEFLFQKKIVVRAKQGHLRLKKNPKKIYSIKQTDPRIFKFLTLFRALKNNGIWGTEGFGGRS